MRLNDIQAAPSPRAPRRRLRIALIGDCAATRAGPGNLGFSGQDVAVGQLAHELARGGHAIDVYARRDAPGQPQVAQLGDNIRLIRVPAGPPCPLRKEHTLAHVDAFSRFVARFVRRQPDRYDIVHAHSFMAGAVAQHLKETLGLPFAVSLHAPGRLRARARAASDPFSSARIRLEGALMHTADRIVAECPQDRTDIAQIYGAPGARIELVPRGFSPGELWPVPMLDARARLGLEPDRFVVLQLGRMAPRKGIDTVIQGVAMLRHRHGLDAQLLVVGGDTGDSGRGAPLSDSPELARLRSLAADLGMAAHVRFMGAQPRHLLRDYYSAANVFASTPWYEPVGITPLEAMACARPVIGSEVGGIKCTVDDGVTGFLVPSRDPEALAERLARLHRHPQLARAMGEAGRRRACEDTTWHHVAAQLLAIYTDVLDEARMAGQAAVFPT